MMRFQPLFTRARTLMRAAWRARAVGFVLLSCVALTVTAGTVTVDVGQTQQTVTVFGGDVKLTLNTFATLTAPQQQAVADALFRDISLNVVRLPLYPEAAPAQGSNDWTYYDKVLAFVSKLPPGVKVFLSPAETVAPGYPAWCTTGANLAQWETEVANYLASQGYPATYIGPGNEDPFSAGFFSEAIAGIKSNLAATIIGPDKYATADSVTFVQNNPSVGFDIYGSHDYDLPAWTVWQSLRNAAGGKDCWYTEATGVGGSGNQVMAGMGRAFQALKGGCNGIIEYQIFNRYARIGTGGALVRSQAYYAYRLLANHTLNKTQVAVALSAGAPETLAFKRSGTVVLHSLALAAASTTFDLSPCRIAGVTRYAVVEGGSGVTQTNLIGTAGLRSFADAQSANVFYTYVVSLEPPRLDGWARAGSNLLLTGSGGAGNGVYYLLSSTNLLTPSASWTRVATNNFAGDGTFSTLAAASPSEPFRIYTIAAP